MIAFLTIELHIEAAQSLKDKRQVVRSLKDRLRASFNVSIAELEASPCGTAPRLAWSASLIRATISMA